MDRILAIKNHDGLCWKCLQSYNKKDINIIRIYELGYGSYFDGISTKIQLCNSCYKDSVRDVTNLWDMEKEVFGYEHERYKHETDMLRYINTLPLQSQQFVKNEFAYGCGCAINMEAQDWIDYELGLISDEKCEEYNLYSPSEKNAYRQRFPTCQHPVNVIYEDNSKDCSCPFGAIGLYEQKPDINISGECYKCEHYIERVTPLKDIESRYFYRWG